MKVYIASHDQQEGLRVAEVLKNAGIEHTSRWLLKSFNPTLKHTEEERQQIADDDISDVRAADALVLIAGPDKYSGGKFVETGIAIGLRKPVIVLGRRENMLLWASAVSTAVDHAYELPRAIKHMLPVEFYA